MKSLLLSFIALAIACSSSAQIQWGIKGGMNISNMRLVPKPANSIFDSEYHLKFGLTAGALLNVPLTKNLSLQPELLYSMEGSKVSATYEKGTLRLNFIQLPVLLQYKIGSRFFAALGPQVAFLAAAKAKRNSSMYITETPNDPVLQPGHISDIKSYYNSFALSGAIGVGYHINKNFVADLRFTHGLTKLTKEDGMDNNGNSFNYRSYSFQLGITYLFSNQTKK
ncbi:MAG: porin family protein [Chitinophagaceae bacterium]